jgi:predicted CopG family antitoxin
MRTLKYTYIHTTYMAHKTITISEQAYHALATLKEEKESFTDAILRLTSEKGSATTLLTFFKGLPDSRDLAQNIDVAMGRMRKATLRKVKLE